MEMPSLCAGERFDLFRIAADEDRVRHDPVENFVVAPAQMLQRQPRKIDGAEQVHPQEFLPIVGRQVDAADDDVRLHVHDRDERGVLAADVEELVGVRMPTRDAIRLSPLLPASV